jgi:hypothetical protein
MSLYWLCYRHGILQDLVGKGMHRRFGISGVELCDDHHTLLPVFFKTPGSCRIYVPLTST